MYALVTLVKLGDGAVPWVEDSSLLYGQRVEIAEYDHDNPGPYTREDFPFLRTRHCDDEIDCL